MARFAWVCPLLTLPLLVTAAPPGYVAPKADGPVAELMDENVAPFLAELTNDTSGPGGEAVREGVHVFAGVEAVRVTPQQRFRTRMPGWAFKIVEAPAKANEFRYLRFAWKKQGGGTLILAFAINGGQWIGRRYSAGPYDLGGSGVKVADPAPTEWTVVTRDVFKDFGPITLDGILFSVDQTGTGYFDHILLGRSVEDLDVATAAALGKTKPAHPLAGPERDALWADLVGRDAAKASAAFRVFLSDSAAQVEFLRSRLPKPADDELAGRVRTLIRDLDSDRFDVREKATRELRKIGRPATAQLRGAADGGPSEEVRFRAQELLRAMGPRNGEPSPEQVRAARVARILERSGTAAGRELLETLAAGEHGEEYAAEAKAALARMPKLRKPPLP